MNYSILDEENKLFAEWAKKRGEFSPDGIIDEQSYLSSNPKLFFIMKEVNSEHGFNLKEFIQEGGRPQTYDNLARWIYGIRHLDQEIEWSFLEEINSDEQRIELFKSICVVNLKKTPGRHTTNNAELWQISLEDKELLNSQFKIYFHSPDTRPNIIIACGSAASNTFNELIDLDNSSTWKKTTRGIYYFVFENDNIFVKYSHPEARVQDCLLYYGLLDAIKEIKKV